MASSSRTRQIFCHQSAQHLIIDVGFPMSYETLQHTVEAAQHTLGIACALRNSERIPIFGMSTINSQYETVVKFMPLKNNFKTISKALNGINLVTTSERLGPEDYTDFIFLAVNTILDDFKRLNCEKDIEISLLEITVVTKKKANELECYLKNLVQKYNDSKITRMQFVEVVSNIEDPSRHSGSIGFIEFAKVHDSEEKLEMLFKNWLLDFECRSEDLILSLPGLRIKCDMNESILDPGSLPFSQRFELPTGAVGCNTSITNKDTEIPIYELKVINRLSNSGLCESFVFGQPIHLTATKNKGEDAVRNQQIFCALCNSLTETEEYLLARLVNDDLPNGYFVLMPGPAVLLLKSVAPSELLLPSQKTVDYPSLPQNVKTLVNNSLQALAPEVEYRPSNLKSGLYCSLIGHLLQKKNVNKRAASGDSISGKRNRKILGIQNTTLNEMSNLNDESSQLSQETSKVLGKRRARENNTLLKYIVSKQNRENR